ncbi:MAG: DUF4191 domain-containing protein [Actinomycetota bacterium]|nr:MAG: DUF4191 domain-containing protein [Actinomycetota bacterium]
MSQTAAGPPQGRFAQIRENFRMTRQVDPLIGWIMLAWFIGVAAVISVVIGLLLNWPTGILIGIPFGIVAAMWIFSRRGMRAAYRQIEGQPGAAAAVAKSMRGGWFVAPGVAVTKAQDVAHRVVGRPGVILLSEGPPSRVGTLLANERRKTARFVTDIPIYEIQVGDQTGQVPLTKLTRHLMKLPKALRPGEVTEVRRRLEALTTSPAPIPKGPMPKNVRMPKGPRG